MSEWKNCTIADLGDVVGGATPSAKKPENYENGEIIEQYETDKPLQSCLVLGLSIENKYLHVVVSHDDEFIYLITVYYPNLNKWNPDYKTRRK